MDRDARIVVLASRNPDKLREMRELAAGLPFDVMSADDYPGLPEVIEDGTTILGNASRKAIAAAAYTGEISVADDTALRVRALENLPDIFAARFAGPQATYADNSDLLVDLMRDVPDGLREACFVSAVAWVDPRPDDVARGSFVDGDARGRWLHDPFARAIHVKDPAAEDDYWAGFSDRRAAWDDYVSWARPQRSFPGVDSGRLAGVLDRLTEPLRHGRRPSDSPPEAMRLPDTRIWTAGSRDEAVAPTIVSPAGLPADAPGRATNQQIWCEISAAGRVWGEIIRSPLGTRGFGYDPVFRPVESDRTLAELDPQEKNALSHRGRALRKLFVAVREAYGIRS